MTALYYAVGTLILLCAGIAFFAVQSWTVANLMLAVQLIGTSGVAVLLLLAVASRNSSILDVGVMVALLAAFSACALSVSTAATPPPPE
jgi:multicomponent Na+:H+ antiporter subunit F